MTGVQFMIVGILIFLLSTAVCAAAEVYLWKKKKEIREMNVSL